MATAVRQPILVIGTHRSGTTLLGRALGHHPEVAYWEEPRHVWSRGHHFRPDDRLEASDATPRLRAAIRRRFARWLAREDRPRLAEKTPSNCLRLPFLQEIFPDAYFVHIFRDGRAVVHSTDRVTRTQTPDTHWYAKRLLGTPIWEWPAFVPRAWQTLGRRLLGREMAFWGPRPPGWKDWLREDDRMKLLALQWRHTIEPVLAFREQVDADRWLDLRYEELVAAPGRHAERVQNFAQLTPSAEFVRHLEDECHSDRVDAWRQGLDEGALRRIRPVLEPALERLGYGW